MLREIGIGVGDPAARGSREVYVDGVPPDASPGHGFGAVKVSVSGEPVNMSSTGSIMALPKGLLAASRCSHARQS